MIDPKMIVTAKRAVDRDLVLHYGTVTEYHGNRRRILEEH